MRAVIFALIAGGLPLGAFAHQSFASPTGPIVQITAPIDSATYDGSIWIMRSGEPVQVSLGNPNSMMKRGLPLASLVVGKSVTIDAFDSAADTSTRLYARRIEIDGRVIDLS
jgi:hypothetical protein